MGYVYSAGSAVSGGQDLIDAIDDALGNTSWQTGGGGVGGVTFTQEEKDKLAGLANYKATTGDFSELGDFTFLDSDNTMAVNTNSGIRYMDLNIT